MFERIKQWREKRRHLKTIQYSFQILRSMYPQLDKTTQYILVKTIWQLIADYNEAFGDKDGVAQFYFDRLDYIVNKYNGLSV